MKITEMIRWLEIRQDVAYSFIRIFLGVALLVRGIVFFSNPAAITELARTDNLYWWYSYITIAHLLGGLFLAVGLLTRFAALFQIPILTGAVFIVHFEQGLATIGQSLELAALVLVLLVIFMFFGSGQLSVDLYIAQKHRAK